jgi:hypothetical protein
MKTVASFCAIVVENMMRYKGEWENDATAAMRA